MLTDPLTLRYGYEATAVPGVKVGPLAASFEGSDSFPIVNIKDGKVERAMTYTTGTVYKKISLVVAHSQSNENKPYDTNRTLVRFDLTGNDEEGKPVIASAYMLTVIPVGLPAAQDKDHINLVKRLVGYLSLGDDVTEDRGDGVETYTDVYDLAPRMIKVMNGEG